MVTCFKISIKKSTLHTSSFPRTPLMGLPYVIIERKNIRTIQDLKGNSIGVGTVAGLPYRLLKELWGGKLP